MSCPAVVVIGYGSIGRKHASAAARRTERLAIVNRRESVRAQAALDHPNACVAESIEAIGEDFPWKSALAVIATWGPSHAAILDRLADLGVRRVLCEKPMAASVSQAHGMVERAIRDGIVLAVNHTLRYSGAVAGLLNFAAAHGLGDPVALRVHGGASCLLTNGIHWIDFASQLFDMYPQAVFSTAKGEPINPRSPDLHMFGGAAVWDFGQGREAVISLNNRSSVFPVAHVAYADAMISMQYAAGERGETLQIEVKRNGVSLFESAGAGSNSELPLRNSRTTDSLPPPAAACALWTGTLPGTRTFLEGIDAAFDDVLNEDAKTAPAAVGYTAVSSTIGALIASRERAWVCLPIDPASEDGMRIWPIS